VLAARRRAEGLLETQSARDARLNKNCIGMFAQRSAYHPYMNIIVADRKWREIRQFFNISSDNNNNNNNNKVE
jgi:hypothetical protein